MRAACARNFDEVSTRLAALVRDYWQLEEDFRVLRFARANFVNQPAHDYLEQPLVLDQLAMLNTTARYQIRRGMSQEQLSNMQSVARRVQNTVVQMDYAKALALNGQMKQAEHELLLIRSLYVRESYLPVEQQWQEWLQRNPAVTAESP